jgi:hypothetical protein
MNPTKPRADRQGIASATFYIGVVVAAFAMWELTHFINTRAFVIAQALDPVALGKAQDAYAAVNNLLITLATGLLAGLGLFVTSRGKRRYTLQECWPAIVSAVCVCGSLYWGYISSQNVEWAIESSIGTLDCPMIQMPRQLQFLSMALGVLFFADFVRRDLTRVD